MGPLFYLQYQMFVNRQKMRLKRLKKPKYLIGAVVGGLYFYFYFFRFVFGVGTRHRASNWSAGPEHFQMIEAFAAAALLVIVLLAWILPHGRAALAFTDAEVNFLFPAPISRRVLVHYKLIRSQIAILFTTLFLTLITGRFRAGGAPWIHAIGWWVILSTLNLHFLGSSFARTMLLDRGVSNWKRRLIVLAVIVVSLGAVVLWAKRTIPGAALSDLQDFKTAKAYLEQVVVSGPLPYLLFPFRLIVRPYLAANAAAFAIAFGPALLVMLVHYVWVVRSNVAFEEASIDLSRRLAERASAMRSGGNMQPRPTKAKRAPFKLSPTGPPAIALLWKNLIGAGQFFTVRIWILLAFSIVPTLIIVSGAMRHEQVSGLIGMGAMMIIIWSILIGPQMLRQDFRQDFGSADILKTYPLRGWQMVLGELLAPAAILTAIQWLLVLVGAGFVGGRLVTWEWRLVGAFATAVIVPGLNLVCLIIPNASVLVFPGWFQAGRDGPQGLEATGQRLILMLGQVLAFVIAMIPGAVIFLLAYFGFEYAGYRLVGVSVGAAGAALALVAECAVAVILLGKVFERLDLSSE